MNYLTGYLPYVSDKNYQRKQIRRRIVFASAITISTILLLIFWGTITSAQDNSPADSSMPPTHNFSQLQITANKPIWTSLTKQEKAEKVLFLAKNSVTQNKNISNKEKVTMTSQIDQLPTSKKIIETSQNSNQIERNHFAEEIEDSYSKDLEILLNENIF